VLDGSGSHCEVPNAVWKLIVLLPSLVDDGIKHPVTSDAIRVHYVVLDDF
jgi:hypothetical protein